MNTLSEKSKPRVCFVMTVPYAIHAYLKMPIMRLIAEGYSITVCTNMAQLGGDIPLPDGIHVIDIPIERAISPYHDIQAFYRLWRLFRREKFYIVHSLLPKSGLLAMTAAWAAGIENRIHTFTGQVWAASHGIRRLFFKCTDKLLAASASRLLADSFSQKDFLVKEKVVSAKAIGVLANGSICGVDLQRFAFNPAARASIRKQYGIAESTVVVLFTGRLTHDKGIRELLQAFQELSEELGNTQAIHLILLGPDDNNLLHSIPVTQNITCVGYADNVEDYYSAADIFCLPSYREGFGSVLIEAAAVGLPIVATRIYGIIDAVRADDTALLVEPYSVQPLREAMATLVRDPGLRQKMGQAGKKRVSELFSSTIVSNAWAEYYRQL